LIALLSLNKLLIDVLIQLQINNILEWTDLETQQWFTLKKWSTHFQALGEPDGDTLARMSLARITKGVQDDVISEDIFKAVGGVFRKQTRAKLITDEDAKDVASDRGALLKIFLKDIIHNILLVDFVGS
jgi:kynureninase